MPTNQQHSTKFWIIKFPPKKKKKNPPNSQSHITKFWWIETYPLPKSLYTLGHKTAKTSFQDKLSILKPSLETYIVRCELPLFTTCKFFHQLACLSPVHLSIQWKHQAHLSLQIRQNLHPLKHFVEQLLGNFHKTTLYWEE